MKYIIYIIILLFGRISIYGEGGYWQQTSWNGGANQLFWSDSSKYSYSRRVCSPQSDLLLSRGGWAEVTSISGATKIYSLVESPDSIIFGTTEGTNMDVFMSTDNGNTWVEGAKDPSVVANRCIIGYPDTTVVWGWHHSIIDKGFVNKVKCPDQWLEYSRFDSCKYIYSILNLSNDTLLVGGGVPSAISYKGVLGKSWTSTPFSDTKVLCLLKASDGTTYAGTGSNSGMVMKSIDNGNNWVATGNLSGAKSIYTIAEDLNGIIYAGTDTIGMVYKSTDKGITWLPTDTMDGALKTMSLLVTSDNSLYAGVTCSDGAYIFLSSDKGENWDKSNELLNADSVFTLLQTSGGKVWAGTGDEGGIYTPSKYFTKGWLISSIYDTKIDNGNITYDSLTKVALTSPGTEIKCKVRTFSDSTDTSFDWTNAPYVPETGELPGISTVHNGARYIQYYAELTTTNLDSTPILNSVSIHYTQDLEGPVIDSAVAYGVLPNDKVIICFSEPIDTFTITSSNIDSLLKLSSNHTWLDNSGNVSAVWDSVPKAFGNSCKILTINLGQNPNSNWVNSGDTIFIQTYQNDSITDRWKNLCVSQCIIGGTFAPYIDSVIASDGNNLQEYVDNDDYVTLYFSKGTNKPLIDTDNINNVLKVHGRTWLDEKNGIRSCIWDANGFVLTCSLKVDSLRPTIQVGDTIFPDSITIQDAGLRGKVISPSVIGGTFGEYGPIMDSAIAHEGLPQEPDIGQGDYALIYFNKLIETLPESLNLDTVLLAQENGVHHTWYHNNSGDSLDCEVQQIPLTDIQGFPYTLLYISFDTIIGVEESRQGGTDYNVRSYPNPSTQGSCIEYQILGQKSPPKADSPQAEKVKIGDGLVVGDTIYPDTNLIKDTKGHPSTNPIVLDGSFDSKGKGSPFSILPDTRSVLRHRVDSYCIHSQSSTHNIKYFVSLKIYNPGGQLVRTLVDESQVPGLYKIDWNGVDNKGKQVKSGLYFYKLNIKERSFTGKLILL